MEMSAFMYLSLKCAHYYANSISLPSRANLCEHIPTDLGLVWGWLCPGVFIVSVCWVLTPSDWLVSGSLCLGLDMFVWGPLWMAVRGARGRHKGIPCAGQKVSVWSCGSRHTV